MLLDDKTFLNDMKLCPSVYISNFEMQKENVMLHRSNNNYIFTSLHVSEELEDDFLPKAMKMCYFLKEQGYKIIADISCKLTDLLHGMSIIEIANKFNIDIVRLDYGFSEDEIIQIAKQIPVAVNVSTMSIDTLRKIKSQTDNIIAIHNFYPRPETGLDGFMLKNINNQLKTLDIPIFAFISSDTSRREPLCEGLPTLEIHRNNPPLLAFCDLVKNYMVDGVIIGDGFISQLQESMIRSFNNTDIIPLPSRFLDNYRDILDNVFTSREDSPFRCIRVKESREYSCKGKIVEPDKRVERRKGAITMDNNLYKRYSGEMQIMRETQSKDDKVNVIGRIHPDYFELVNCINNGSKFMFIDEDKLE